MQLCMADFLIELAKHERNIIVETHSDHFINRVVRRYMEDESVRDKIKIYFIDKNGKGESGKVSVDIDLVEGALCEDENFFYQFSSETERIIDIGYRNLEKQRNSNV